jgi:hypothetical protein
MANQLTAKKPPAVRRPGLIRMNTMAFPRALRNAIPDLHGGRVLELDSVNGQSTNTNLFGPQVSLKLVVQETGKLTGKFVVGMALLPDAARTLAATLAQLADEAESKEPIEVRVMHRKRKP